MVFQHKIMKILDSLDAAVYVTDMESHELLFVNQYIRDIFGDIEGTICWQTLQNGQDGPCSFCTNDKLLDENGEPAGEFVWEFCNTINNRWYHIVDRAIEWVDNRLVRLEIATDITERKRAQEALSRRSKALEVVSKGNEALIRAATEDDLLHDICRLVVAIGGYRMAWIAYAMPECQPMVVKPMALHGEESCLVTVPDNWEEPFPVDDDPLGRVVVSGKRMLVQDLMTIFGADHPPWGGEAIKQGCGSVLILPLFLRAGPVGSLIIHGGSPSEFDDEAIDLLEELANNLSYGIQSRRDSREAEFVQAELARTNEQLNLLLDSLPIIPFTRTAEPDFPFSHMSNVVKEITGYTPEQFLQDPRFWEKHLFPEDRSLAISCLEKLRKEDEWKGEYRFQVADGSYTWFANYLRARRGPKGELYYITGTWQDISEEKKLQLESEQRLQQVIQADKLASLGQVVAGVAHEINNPNSFITYNVPLLEESWETFLPIINEFCRQHPEKKAGNITLAEMTDEMGEIIAAIKTGSDRINTIVGKLKDFARLDETVPDKLVEINNIIQDSLAIVGAQARKLVGRITMELADGLPQFYGHYQKLEQVVANLILNAAQSIPSKEGGVIFIRSRYVKRLHAVLIELEDNGRGISADDVPHIFDPFFTTKRDHGGTGLGLSVSYGLIKEHNGRIAVMSRPGLGTKFTVFLPVDRRQGLLELRPTMLCIDDDPMMLGLLKSFFIGVKKMPMEIMENGHEVLGFLEDHPEIDLVLSDIAMPGITGWQVLQQIKERFPLMSVILITGEPDEARYLPEQSRPPDYFITKPLDLPKLSEMINSIGRQRL
ncbi:MAG: PAS domain-containing protein [Proteobacteria bacterium]|nr:PAS domain-containing protein [Pseudomonadota bacterium]MBU1687406.1 PAS domain-containing protein [Pseudomonadota bacterium]